MRPSYLQLDRIRARIAEREAADAIQTVVDGGDLDNGRVSLSEFIGWEQIVLDADEIATLIVAPDCDYAQRIRSRVEEQLKRLVREWFETPRGQDWLEQRVQECVDDELADAEEQAAAARAEERLMRSA